MCPGVTGAHRSVVLGGVYWGTRRKHFVTSARMPVDTLNLKLPDYYINRELSQLAFNVRVLAAGEGHESFRCSSG